MAKKFQVKIKNGDILKGWSWPAENATANLTIMTGMNEYALRYDRVAKWFNEHGVNVWCLDAYGQGRNAASEELQERWPLGAYRNNVEALRVMVKKAAENGLPTFLMGHSMGSFMVQSFMERYHDCTSGIILCGSNGGQAALMRFGYRLARALVHDWNWFETNSTLQDMGVGGFAKAIKDRETDYDWLSYNKENVQAYINDPWCGHDNTGGFWKEFMGGLSRVWNKKEMEKISGKEKVLIIAGQDDPVGRMGQGPAWLHKRYTDLGLSRVDLRIYPGMRHEILNETDREKVYSDILAFMQECTD